MEGGDARLADVMRDGAPSCAGMKIDVGVLGVVATIFDLERKDCF